VPIGIYLAPGANAVTTAKAVQATLAKLSERFPPGLTYLVRTISTTFVSDTITEVLKTLGEAFVLVVIVVFLFLGNMRATIIPAVAVPVSLIGTFAVLLALGYSANTVSLLAMVLAIGIVVDDAIVVVENVERVMEEEPDLTPGRSHQEGDGADHRADHRDFAGAAVGVRADRLHSRNFRHAVPPVRGDDQRGDGDLGAERADPVAGAVRGVPASHRAAARHHGARARRHRLGARPLCGGVRRLLRMAALSLVLVLVFAGGIFGVALLTPTGFLPEEDQGAFFIAVQLPDGASVARTSEVTKQVEALLKKMPAVDHVLSIIGFSLLDGGSEPNAAFMVARMKPFADRKAAADSVQATIRRTFGAGRRSGRPTSCRSTCRRSSGSRPAAASNTSSTRWKDRTRRARQRDAAA
jgi:multidrug efflux pump subunit AcrB